MLDITIIWFVFLIALYRTLTLFIESFKDYRNTLLLCSENTSIGRIHHPNYSRLRIFITALSWTVFGFLLMNLGL